MSTSDVSAEPTPFQRTEQLQKESTVPWMRALKYYGRMGYARAGLDLAENDERLDAIERLCDDARTLDAWTIAQELGPLHQWQGVKAGLTAARLARHLGAGRLSRRLIVRAHRRFPDQPETWFWYTCELWESRGPLEAWLYLKALPSTEVASPTLRADLLELLAQLAGALGDFAVARDLLQAVDESLRGNGDWLAARASIELREDEPKRALETCLLALSQNPSARKAGQHAAAVLELLDRRDEALRLISELDDRVQAAVVTSQRAAIEHESEQLIAEGRSLSRMRERSPLLDRDEQAKLAWREANNAYLGGNHERAIALYRSVERPESAELVARIERNGAKVRRRLNLHGVVQERLGCAPATIAMLTGYFGLPLDHVDVADQICYEGTPAQTERAFVEGLGWIHREFTLTYSGARQLIDRGVPFGVVTVETASAHMQAVIGYDDTTETLLIRDPMHPALVEAYADKFFERYRPFGPRAVVVLPPSEAHRVEGLELVDEAMYDGLYRLSRHLDVGKRELAVDELQRLSSRSAEHRLTLWARRALAAYDADTYRIRECSEALLKLYPGEVNARLSVLNCLREIGNEAERRSELEAAGAKKGAAWVFCEQLAEMLVEDASQSERARRLLVSVLRRIPTRAQSIGLLARLVVSEDEARALELFRLAACLEPTDRNAARVYFERAYWLGRSNEALEWLRHRWARFRKRSAEPTIALFDALEQLDRVDEAFAMLAEATGLRSDDSRLWLFVADCQSRYRRFDEAEAALNRCKELVPSSAYHFQAAALAETRGSLTGALSHLREVVALEPLSVPAHRMITRLLSELEGPEEARAHLKEVRGSFPLHAGLLTLEIDWLSGHDPELTEGALQELIRLQPSNAWAHRELALVLRDRDLLLEARLRWNVAQGLAPRHPSTHAVCAAICLAEQDYPAAREALRRSLELWPDMPSILGELLATFPLASERKAELEAQFERAKRETVNGILLLEWFALAQPLVAADSLVELATGVNAARRQLWASFRVLGQQQLRHGEIELARNVLKKGIRRFPYVPGLWLDLAEAEGVAGNRDGEREALEKALTLNPEFLGALSRLVAFHQRHGDVSAARRVLDHGLRFAPRSQALHEIRADLEWNTGNHQAAIEALERAILIDPASAAGWSQLHQWGAVVNQPDLAQRRARELATQRPWNAELWCALAEVLLSAHEFEAALRATDEALQRAPNSASARNWKAIILTRLRRRDDALSACSTDGLRGRAMAGIMSRAAWVVAQFGELDDAIARIERVVAEHPDHSWAWQLLIDWRLEKRELEGACAAARKLVELTPLDASAHGYLASVLLEVGDENGAVESLTRALNLKLDYLYAAETLIQIQVKRKKFKRARQTLELVALTTPFDFRLSWAVRIAAQSKDDDEAWRNIESLVAAPTANPGYLELARAAVTGRDRTAAQQLFALALKGGAHAEVGALWIRSLVAWGMRPAARHFRMLSRYNGPAGQTALREWFEHLGDENQRIQVLVSCLLRWRDVKDVQVWGKVGYALVTCRWYELAVHWLKNYERRAGVRPWMLHNLRVAALGTHRLALARGAVDAALRLPSDDTLPYHLAFASFVEITEGRVEEARRLVGGVHASSLTSTNRWLVDTTTAFIEQLESPVIERSVSTVETQLRQQGFWRSLGWFGLGILMRRAARAGLRIRRSPTLALYAYGNWLVLTVAMLWFSFIEDLALSFCLTALIVLVAVTRRED